MIRNPGEMPRRDLSDDAGFDPEEVSFESVSTENSEEDGANRAYVPCGVGVTVQVG